MARNGKPGEDRSVPEARHVRKEICRAGLHAYEAAYDPGSRLPEHGHSAPFFTYVLHGSYVESAGHKERQCSRGAVIFHDRESHQNLVGPAGTASFNVELHPELWRELIDDSHVINALAGRVLQGDIEWSALQVWREFLETNAGSTLGIEESVAWLCEATRRAQARGAFEPRERLDRCVSYLEANPLEDHRLANVAQIAGVHPMHLAKLFRRRYGHSMGEYLRRRRIAWACGRLASTDQSITSIAMQAGFADHPHFTRTFVRVTGCTPNWYRAQLAR